MRLFYILILSLLAGWLPGQEAILSYDVGIEILSDSRIEVTETIQVRAEGNAISRGIFRTIPILRPDKQGRDEPAPIHIRNILRDGKKENYSLEKSRKDLVIRIGEKSVILQPGVYTYTINYMAENQIGFFEEYDELYWNVIGHDWSFPIHKYSVTIHLPTGADFIQGSCYTGIAGSSETNCTLNSIPESGEVYSEGNAMLYPGQGFTVAVAWPKGFVTEENNHHYGIGWINYILYAAGLLFFMFYGYNLWSKVGIDPPEITVVPDWHPPGNYSPAEINYLYNRKISNEAVSAALVSAGVKGVIRIENNRKKFTFHRLTGSEVLDPEEKALIDGLLPPGEESFTLKSSGYSRYQSAKNDFNQSLAWKLNISEYFKQNWTAGLKAIVLVAVITTLGLSIGMYPLLTKLIYSSLMTFLLIFVLFLVISFLFRILAWYKWIFIIPGWLLMTGFFVVIYSQALFYTTNHITVGAIFGIGLFLVGLFNYLIYAPTPKGQKTTAEVKGFRMYLDKSEKAMLEYFTPPEKTPELFEKMLPFAIALGVENNWGNKFKKILDEAIEKGTYTPLWYTGNIHQINSLHSNFQSSVSHAAPKSSSGSGGGGFSGGGGGGGGGGGW